MFCIAFLPVSRRRNEGISSCDQPQLFQDWLGCCQADIRAYDQGIVSVHMFECDAVTPDHKDLRGGPERVMVSRCCFVVL
jgi:hypothetical protein